MSAAAAAGIGLPSACTDGVGDCPLPAAIKPDAACSPEQLQCDYNLEGLSPACDGTNSVTPTSCTCMGGVWSCPAPVTCGSATTMGGDGGSSSGSSDAGSDGGGDAGSNG
jgi:hypothetical protein